MRFRAMQALLTLTIAGTAIGVGATVARAADVGEDGSGPAPMPWVYPREATDLTRLRAATTVSFSDVGYAQGWALSAIQDVAGTNAWMRDFAANDDGSYPFFPETLESRKYFARSLVRAFAPDQVPDLSVRFSDLDASSPWYRFAAIAVANGWMQPTQGGAFAPDDPIRMASVHRGLVFALGLGPTVKDLNKLHTATGQRFRIRPSFGSLVLGMRLEFRYNAPSGSESQDVGPRDPLSRAQVAYSLARATSLPSGALKDMRDEYDRIELPTLGPRKYELVQWGIRYAGYPYVWGGEWGLDSPEPSALGGQPRSGFDCSGFSWWLLRGDDGAWNITPPRPYDGWSLPQRTSAEMAANAPVKLRYRQLEPGDLMFYDGNGDGTVDHVDTFIGNGFALDSSSTPGGVSIMWVGSGWYRQHFVHGRRILPG